MFIPAAVLALHSHFAVYKLQQEGVAELDVREK